MGVDLVLVSRTDALSAVFLDSNIDPVDQPFILGCIDPKNLTELHTFPEAGRISIMQHYRGEDQDRILKIWDQSCYNMSLKEA